MAPSMYSSLGWNLVDTDSMIEIKIIGDLQQSKLTNAGKGNALLRSSRPRMAGYLGLSSTSALDDIIDKDPVKTLLKDWVGEFRLQGKASTKNLNQIIARLEDKLEHKELLSVTRPSTAEKNAATEQRFYAWTVIQIILQSELDCFEGSKPCEFGAQIQAEDVHRAYALCCNYQKSYAATKSTRQQSKPAVLPAFSTGPTQADPETNSKENTLEKLLIESTVPHSDLDAKFECDEVEELEEIRDDAMGESESQRRVGILLVKSATNVAPRQLMTNQTRQLVISNIIGLVKASNEDVKDVTLDMSASMSAAIECNENRQETDIGDEATLRIKTSIEVGEQNKARIRARYLAAAEHLGLDPQKPSIGQHLTLRAWQVEGVSWMIRQEESKIKSGILNDSCGLGKTIQALSLVYLAGIKRTSNHRPTIIVANNACLDVWTTEVKTRFSGLLTLYIFHGSNARSTTDTFRKTHTVDDISTILTKHTPDDPKSSLVVVLTTYQTWYHRTRTTEDDTEHETEAIESSANQESPSQVCKFHGAFARAICDEGHYLKNSSAKQNQHWRSMSYESVWLLTATPFLNKVSDLMGYLQLIHQEEWAVFKWNSFDAKDEIRYQIRKVCKKDIMARKIVPVELLDPNLFKTLMVKGDLESVDSHLLVPRIMAAISIARGMSTLTVNNQDASLPIMAVGSTIPKYKITTVEIEHTEFSKTMHDLYFERLLPELHPGVEANKDRPRMNMHIFRMLSAICIDPKLYILDHRLRVTLASEVRRWQNQFGDVGASFYYANSTRETCAVPPASRAEMALYLARSAPKLCYLVKLLTQKKGKKCLVFLKSPMTLWLALLLLDLLEFKALVIHAGMDADEREQAARNFNDPAHDCQVLLTTYACGGVGLNLHGDCNTVILVEPALNVNTIIQAIGRLHRLGQQQEQEVFILFLQHSWDRFIEHNSAKKMVGQIVADNADMFDKFLAEIQARVEHKWMSLPSERNQYNEATAKIVNSACIRLKSDFLNYAANSMLMQMLGQKHSRLAWREPKTLGYQDCMEPTKTWEEYLAQTVSQIISEVDEDDADPDSEVGTEVATEDDGAEIATEDGAEITTEEAGIGCTGDMGVELDDNSGEGLETAEFGEDARDGNEGGVATPRGDLGDLDLGDSIPNPDAKFTAECGRLAQMQQDLEAYLKTIQEQDGSDEDNGLGASTGLRGTIEVLKVASVSEDGGAADSKSEGSVLGSGGSTPRQSSRKRKTRFGSLVGLTTPVSKRQRK
ncbi:hypothetical protein MGYG_08572 [Nannizzia gypsea CBS 118893]|uniref:Helicase C-terminal domain-containing protein n=1 Tax=Arthroderma gypseum (strain ATCC MYA-4604 / CBS 118893) TaxID=535722 RepID=E4V632_ARTGP|nr:hypothetical protein MGYG_08572 [Nannizzia gypsea CBS 118893]EFR05557.1 hypothetical protein MGYG_08572 [Nannizzia gypsea CBS 118893]